MGGLSIWHWLIVLVVVMLLFGTGKVSNLMGEFGKGIKTFKQNVASEDDEHTCASSRAPEPASTGEASAQRPTRAIAVRRCPG